MREIKLNKINEPKNLEIYEVQWNNSSGEFNKNRRSELYKLLHPKIWADWAITGENYKNHKGIFPEKDITTNLKTYKVLDLCAGHGAYSIAAAELGASEVWMVDGSEKTFKNFNQRLNQNRDLNIELDDYKKIIKHYQIDADNLTGKLPENYFDFCFARYSIMHLENPFQTVFNLAKATKAGGIISYNWYGVGNVLDIQRKIRQLIFAQNIRWKDVHEFLYLTGYLSTEKYSKKALEQPMINIEELGGDFSKVEEKIKNHLNLVPLCKIYNRVINEYGILETKLYCTHWETLITPYIHNFSDGNMLDYVKSFGLKILESAKFINPNRDESRREENFTECSATIGITKTFKNLEPRFREMISNSNKRDTPWEWVNDRATCRKTGNLV